MPKYYFKPNLDRVKISYFDNAGHEFDVDESIFNAILMVEADNEDIAQQIRGGFTDITQWDMIDIDTGDVIPYNLNNPEPWQI